MENKHLSFMGFLAALAFSANCRVASQPVVFNNICTKPPVSTPNRVSMDTPLMGNGDYHLNYNFHAPFFSLHTPKRLDQAEPPDIPLVDFIPNGIRTGAQILSERGRPLTMANPWPGRVKKERTGMATNPGPENPTVAPGYPDRSASLDVLPGFKNPPPGYGEVPFWWWTGDTLHPDRLIAQIRELHRKGISGVQVNYSHYDTPGWLTEQDEPDIFTEEWWKVYSRISAECAKLDMGIGLSTYTIDWPRGADNLFYKLFYHKQELNAIELQQGFCLKVKGDTKVFQSLSDEPVKLATTTWAESTDYTVQPRLIRIWAYPVRDGITQSGGIDLTGSVRDGRLEWTAPDGEWEIREFLAVRRPGTMNPLLPGAGDTIIRGYFQQFEDRAGSSEGLNYFFNDELHIGVGKYAWNPDFPEEFAKRMGYDLFEFLPALFGDIGPVTPKFLMDYADVRMSLMEERYFRPIYEWHYSRGMIFGCDSESRGLYPAEFGDYFRGTRWYTAPGHDTPGGRADPVKGRVSASIANLYQRPRVWLEGYHSLGWGATPEQLMYATRENYLYGCTLLNLHGLYYTTYGSFWEWAPPCYHFRMPYWDHMKVFLDYFERLSYLLSQGHVVCDVAVVYPVAPYEAEMNGDQARITAFDLGRELLKSGINFEFIDNESLERAIVEDGLLQVKEAGAAYQVLVFPDMSAVRWPSIEKAAAFARAGGMVCAVGNLPSASDHAGRLDPELDRMNAAAFRPLNCFTSIDQAVTAISVAFVQDVRGTGKTVRALHRKAGFRDVYLVMDASPGMVVEFRAKGAAELWDPWTGNVTPLRVVAETTTGTLVELPLEDYEANIVVFTPGQQQGHAPAPGNGPSKEIGLPNEWTVSFVPTMDNSWGDFRMPLTKDNKIIGIEARRLAWARETDDLRGKAMLPVVDDEAWERKLHGYGTQFYILGPVPEAIDRESLTEKLSGLKKVDPSVPVYAGGYEFRWKPYDFSWRWGKEGDQGHQGYHGLKRTVTDDFICLGKPEEGLNETRYVEETAGGYYYLWTTATADHDVIAELLFSDGRPSDKSHTSTVLVPGKVFVDGTEIQDFKQEIHLKKGANPLLVRYEHAGRGHLVLRRKGVPAPAGKQPLSMRWTHDPGLIRFDICADERQAEWFRFTTAPGTRSIKIIALGDAEAWIDGYPMIRRSGKFISPKPFPNAAKVAIRITPGSPGFTGGELIPEPIAIETGSKGIMETGDWSKTGILNNYSGGIRYKTNIQLTGADVTSPMVIDLGRVAGTAEVTVNGKRAGIRVAPPWKLDITGLTRKGMNTIEVLVYNTLANHYQTIPSRYKGNPVSGLLGPVKLVAQ